MVTEAATGWYANPDVWTALIAVMALILSQAPPVMNWFRPEALKIELHNFLNVGHHVGRPGVQLFVMVRNRGGRIVRIKRISVIVKRGELELFRHEAQGYFETPTSETATILVPFQLEPGEEWSHLLNFFRPRDRDDERRFRQEAAALAASIRDGLDARRIAEPDNTSAFEAPAEVVSPMLARFEREFVWDQGEYQFEVAVSTERKTFSSTYRFVLFESDRDDLRRYSEDYCKGFGPVFADRRQSGINVPIVSAESR